LIQQVDPNVDYDVVWRPLPGTSQEFAITTPAHHTLYYGARGPGKTLCQLMRFRARVGLGYESYWRGVIFDREFKHLEDLVTQGNRFFHKFDDGVEWKKSASDYKWVWPTGEELLLRHVKQKEDYNSFHGHEYPYLGWNELTKWSTPDLYDLFMSVNRSSFQPNLHTPHQLVRGQRNYLTLDGKPLPPIPLEVFSTTNSSGPGRNWVKKRFIDVVEPGTIARKEIRYYDEFAQKDVVVERTQVAIFGSFYENPYLDPIYKAGLIQSCEADPNKYASWIEGRWDVSEGGAIDDLWKSDIHVISRRPIPAGWKLDRSFDWGSTHPFACIWWAEANGEMMQWWDGKTFREWTPARGSLIAIQEYYGSGIKPNTGLKMSAKDIALGIVEREKALQSEKWIHQRIQSGPADNQIRDVRESDVETIEQKMAKEGVIWTKSDKSAGSRKNGLQLMRDRLQASSLREGPAIYFMNNCTSCIETLPILPRDPDNLDDVDTDSEDHLWDAVRYRVLSGNNQYVTKLQSRWNR